MSEKPKVCVYYSEGPHLMRVLRALRSAYPAAEITTLLPPNYPVLDEITALVNSVARTERTHYSPRELRACFRLVRQIRAGRFDVFAVMFDSNQLLLLAALSGASVCVHGTMDGRLAPIRGSLLAALCGISARLLRGHCVYAAAWLAVHLLPVRKSGRP